MDEHSGRQARSFQRIVADEAFDASDSEAEANETMLSKL